MASNESDLINQYANQNRIPPWILQDIVSTESGGNASAIGDNGTSFGLLQLHYGGQANGYTPAQLLDPSFNLAVGTPYIAQAYSQAPAGLQGFSLLSWVADHSGHPDSTGQMPSAYAAQLQQAYNQGGPLNGDTGTPAAVTQAKAGTGDFLVGLDNTMQMHGSLLNPGPWIEGFALRTFLILLGLILIIFGLIQMVGSDNITKAATVAAMA